MSLLESTLKQRWGKKRKTNNEGMDRRWHSEVGAARRGDPALPLTLQQRGAAGIGSCVPPLPPALLCFPCCLPACSVHGAPRPAVRFASLSQQPLAAAGLGAAPRSLLSLQGCDCGAAAQLLPTRPSAGSPCPAQALCLTRSLPILSLQGGMRPQPCSCNHAGAEHPPWGILVLQHLPAPAPQPEAQGWHILYITLILFYFPSLLTSAEEKRGSCYCRAPRDTASPLCCATSALWPMGI